MLFVQIFIIIIAIGYLVYLRRNKDHQKNKMAKTARELAAAKAEVAAKEKNLNGVENCVFPIIANTFGQETVDNIKKGLLPWACRLLF